MKTVRKICAALLAFVLLLSPLAISVGAVIALPDPFEKSFTSALDTKYDRLGSIDGEKIVIIGGSSVAFGVRSDIIEEYTDMPVVNFGLYAALGTKLMLDLSRSAIGKGDIVIVTPELSYQTLSLYFNTEMTVRAIGTRWDMRMELPMDDKLSLISGMWDYAAEKMKYYKLGLADPALGKLEPPGVYNSDNFNEYGDLEYERVQNEMPLYYDTNNMIDPGEDIISDEFIEYLNSYVAYCNMRGAKVYFNFCPMNEMGFVTGAGIDELNAFADYLDRELNCEIIGSPERSVLGAGYFYDTNFHPNDAGAVKYTAALTEDILFELDIPRAVDMKIPAEPPLPEFDSFLEVYDENEKYFTYTELLGGAYAISGLTELGKSAGTLTAPIAYNNRRVISISAGALSGITATKLIITENTSIRTLSDGCFAGAGSLSELWIYYSNEEDILPPNSFAGVADGFTVHVPTESAYPSGYYWGERGLTFIRDAN